MSKFRLSQLTTSGVLGLAIVWFMVLAAIQLSVGFAVGAAAVTLAGLHNLLEFVPLSLASRTSGRQSHDAPSLWNCHISLLSPALVAGFSLLVAISLAAFERLGGVQLEITSRRGLLGLILLESVDLGGSFFFGHQVEARHSHNEGAHDHDPQAHGAGLHLYGDAAGAGSAIFAYIGLLFRPNWHWPDPAAAVVGVLIMIVINRRSIMTSIRAWLEHTKAPDPHGTT